MNAVQNVLGRLEAVRQIGKGQWMARCPAHDDRNPSLSISEGKEGVVMHCHAGCDQHAVIQAVGVEARDLFHEPNRNGGNRPEILETYSYHDEDGGLLFQVVRLHPKDFRQRRPATPSDSPESVRDGWVWSTRDVRRVLYRLPVLVEAAALGKLIYVVEGEKDVHAIENAGGVATTNPGGAGKWRPEYSAVLAGAHLQIIADRDEPGLDHAHQVAASLEGVARVVEIVQAREGKDAADHLAAGHGLSDFLPLDGEEETPGTFPAPMGMRELLAVDEPEESYQFQDLIEHDSNVLIVAAPKSHKTNFALHLGVAGCGGRAALGAFPAPDPLRMGLVLMEDRPHRVRRRVTRMALSEGIDLESMDGRLFIWFRPPLRLGDADAVRELSDHVERLDLDTLIIDSYSYVSVGDSNSADEVTPQLQMISALRDRRPGLCVMLIVHAGKHQEGRGDRVTDIIRGSGAFGAWHDTAILLTRKDEHAPVSVRVEHRDLPSPEAFAFTVEDEFQGTQPSGYLRLRRSTKTAEQIHREQNGAKLAPELLERLSAFPEGVSRRELRGLLEAPYRDVEAAFEVLQDEGKAMYTPPAARGRPARYTASVPSSGG